MHGKVQILYLHTCTQYVSRIQFSIQVSYFFFLSSHTISKLFILLDKDPTVRQRKPQQLDEPLLARTQQR